MDGVYISLRPSRGYWHVNVAEVFRFKDLLLVLAGRDIKLRYRQTALGIAWVVLQPLLAAGVFHFVFGVIAGLRFRQVPYFVFSFAGLLAWNLFSSTLSKASASLIGNSYLISKVYFPRVILPLSTTVSTMIDLVVGLVMLAVLLAAYQVTPGWQILLLPMWVGLLLLAGLGVGLVGATLTVHYRDVQYLLPVMIPFLLYASPVAYRVSDLPIAYQRAYYLANPLASLLEGFRWSLLAQSPPPWPYVITSAICAFTLFLLGSAVFGRMERRIADVI